MKRAVFVGAVAFLLGAASSPRAANENETLALLCKRYSSAASGVERLHDSFLSRDRDGASSDRRSLQQRDEAVVISLRAVRDMVCVGR